MMGSLSKQKGKRGEQEARAPKFHAEFFVPGMMKGKPRPRAVIRGAHAGVRPGEADKEWKATIRLVAFKHRPQEPLDCPVKLSLTFRMKRPKGHTGRRGLKAWAPRYHTGKPDADNAAGSVMDALTEASMWRDDAVVSVLGVGKVYTEVDVENANNHGVWIEVEEL